MAQNGHDYEGQSSRLTMDPAGLDWRDMTEKATSLGFRSLSSRVIDSALLIAIALAVLQYAGWTYRQAYLTRFGIDPSSLESASFAVAVEGLDAILTTIRAWLSASVSLIVTAFVTWRFIRWVENRKGSHDPVANRAAIRMIYAGGTMLAILFILLSGKIAGKIAAADRIVEVHQGQVRTYHLEREILVGVPLAQSKETTWLLTKTGVRLIRTVDIRTIDGPLFQELSNKALSPAK